MSYRMQYTVCTNHSAVSPTPRKHRSSSAEVKWELALTIAPNNPFTKILLPIPESLDFYGLEIIVPKEGMLLLENTSVVQLN